MFRFGALMRTFATRIFLLFPWGFFSFLSFSEKGVSVVINLQEVTFKYKNEIFLILLSTDREGEQKCELYSMQVTYFYSKLHDTADRE